MEKTLIVHSFLLFVPCFFYPVLQTNFVTCVTFFFSSGIVSLLDHLKILSPGNEWTLQGPKMSRKGTRPEE